MGQFGVCVGETEIRGITRKSRALLGYLALSESGEETRERLVGMLWSETSEDKARASLRQALYDTREQFEMAGYKGLIADKLTVKLDRSSTDVDLWNIFKEAKLGRSHPRLLEADQPIDCLLQDLETLDPAYRIWLLAKRQSLGGKLTRDLEIWLRRDPSDCLALARALMNLDPTHEEAARALIRLTAQAGDIGGAFRIYKTLWNTLEEEYDVEPSKETQDLITALRLDGGPPVASEVIRDTLPKKDILAAQDGTPARASTLQAMPSNRTTDSKVIISIGAFDVSSISENQRYLVSGFRRDLIASLVRFREWFICEGVLPADRQLAWAGANGEYAIEAGAFADSESVRLTLTLRETVSNIYLWSERVHISIANWSEAQQLVLRRLTAALNIHLSAGRLASVTPATPKDVLAYDDWLRGQALFFDWKPTSWHEASDIFKRVIEKSPTFAPAYSSLAQLQNTMHFVHPGVLRTYDRTRAAISYARESARLDPIDSRAHLCLGWALATANQHDKAAMHHELACELNEYDPWTMVSGALGYAFRGEENRARTLADYALSLALTPSAAHWRYQCMIRYICGDNEASITAAEQAGNAIPNVILWKIAALNELGRADAAKRALEEFFSIVGTRWFGDASPTPEAMSRWILQAFPIKSPDLWERLRKHFGRAGAPIERIAYNDWLQDQPHIEIE